MAAPRPRVVCNFAPSLDGKIAPAHKRAPFVMSRHGEDPRRMHVLRAGAQAVIVGATNLRADDPDLMPCPIRVVVTRAGDQIGSAAKVFAPQLGGEAVVAHAASMPEAKRAELRRVATLVELGSSRVDVLRLLEWLAVERGCATVLCEGGGVLVADLFAARAVDELYVTVVPRVLGGASAPTMVEGDGFEPDAIPDAKLASVETIGDELFVRYEFSWPR